MIYRLTTGAALFLLFLFVFVTSWIIERLTKDADPEL
jgi:flagellar biogenesis protein FliO